MTARGMQVNTDSAFKLDSSVIVWQNDKVNRHCTIVIVYKMCVCMMHANTRKSIKSMIDNMKGKKTELCSSIV